MKKLILTAVCAAATVSGFAQGTMSFANGNQTPVYVATALATSYAASLKATSATLSSGGVIDVGLLWGTSAASVNTLAGVVTMSTTAGVFNGNTVYAIPGTNPNDSDWFAVVAWDSSYGNTLAGEQECLAAGGLWGSSLSTAYGVIGGPLQFSLAATAGPGTVMFGSVATTGVFHYFALTTSPEPTTLALGGLGAAALLMFRRRK
jgi:hypothetical protein